MRTYSSEAPLSPRFEGLLPTAKWATDPYTALMHSSDESVYIKSKDERESGKAERLALAPIGLAEIVMMRNITFALFGGLLWHSCGSADTRSRSTYADALCYETRCRRWRGSAGAGPRASVFFDRADFCWLYLLWRRRLLRCHLGHSGPILCYT